MDGWSQIHSQRKDVQEKKKKMVLLQHRRRVWVFWAMVTEMADGQQRLGKKMQIGKKKFTDGLKTNIMILLNLFHYHHLALFRLH